MKPIRYLNDGSHSSPRLKIYLNLGTIRDLPSWSILPALQGNELYSYLQSQGFEGVQDGDPKIARALKMGTATSGRVTQVHEIEDLAQKWKDQGHEAATLHVGTGYEDDSQMDLLVNEVLKVSEKRDFPLYIETHRATITQDAWRTIQLVKRIPEIRFNGDFSHFYTGQEMAYGDIHEKYALMEGIFNRVGFMHGRIGNTSCLQVNVGDGNQYVPQHFKGAVDFLTHFKEMWTLAMKGFQKGSQKGDYLVFAPEILPPQIYYGRMFVQQDGTLREESDRFQQALVYRNLALDCFEKSKR